MCIRLNYFLSIKTHLYRKFVLFFYIIWFAYKCKTPTYLSNTIMTRKSFQNTSLFSFQVSGFARCKASPKSLFSLLLYPHYLSFDVPVASANVSSLNENHILLYNHLWLYIFCLNIWAEELSLFTLFPCKLLYSPFLLRHPVFIKYMSMHVTYSFFLNEPFC